MRERAFAKRRSENLLNKKNHEYFTYLNKDDYFGIMWDHLFCFFEQYYLWLFGIDFIKDKKYDLEFQNKYLEIAVKKTFGWSIDPPKKISVNTKHAFLHINAVPHRNHPFGIFIRGDYLARKLK